MRETTSTYERSIKSTNETSANVKRWRLEIIVYVWIKYCVKNWASVWCLFLNYAKKLPFSSVDFLSPIMRSLGRQITVHSEPIKARNISTIICKRFQFNYRCQFGVKVLNYNNNNQQPLNGFEKGNLKFEKSAINNLQRTTCIWNVWSGSPLISNVKFPRSTFDLSSSSSW